MGFNLADYQPVEERNRQFWDKHPEGRIVTDILFQDGTRYICRAEVYTDRDDIRPAATGHAEEIVTGRGVNQTSALENCETSAEGRALARLGFAPKGARPSREEMDKANRQSTPPERSAAPRNGAPAGPPRTPEQRAADAVKVILASPTPDAVETARKRVLKAPPEVQTVDVSGLVPEAQRDVLGVRPGEAVTLSELADLRLDVLATAADAKAAS